ncbi:winged helix-turn-helix domain-containing protein [Actinosynnema sp. NPDC051121]
MGKLGFDESAPPYLRVAAAVASKVESGEYAPGAQLPSLTALAESYGVAIGTVRSALNLLRDKGIVVTRAGSGSFVRRDVQPDSVSNLLVDNEIGGVAQMLELLHEINGRLKSIEDQLKGR